MADIKISQLTAKGSNLSNTDLFEVSVVSGLSHASRSITGQEIIDGVLDNISLNLQSVTDNGNTTTNKIIIQREEEPDSNVGEISTTNIINGRLASIGCNGTLSLRANNSTSILKNSNVTNENVTLEFPNKPTGDYTIATTADIPSTPNLQDVTVVGNTTTKNIIVDNTSGIKSTIQTGNISTRNDNEGTSAQLSSKGQLILKTGLRSSALQNTNVTSDSLNLEFPNKPTGNYTIATTDDIPVVSGFVPYTGATTNVDLGEYEIKVGQLTLDTSPTGTAVVSSTRWNDTLGVTETTLKGGNVILKNGIDLVTRVVNKVTPNTTLTKASYKVVRVSGAQGQRLAVAYAQANNDNNSADTLGVVIDTIPTNQEGFIMTVGQLEEINTSGSLQGETWADGDVLYLSPTTAGNVTNVKPTGATGHIVVIGYVEYAHAIHGKIYVKIMNGWELDELHNVYINSGTLANNDALIYESSTQLWKNKTIATALGFTPVPTTRTISTNSPLSGGGDLSSNRTLSIADAAADGTTKGAATFTASDFNATSGVISIDYTNGQAASASNKGFLTSADWTTFNNKGNGTVTNVSALTLGTTGTDLSSSVATGTTTPVITLNVPTASATNRGVLSSADWTTFNGKQNSLGFTPENVANKATTMSGNTGSNTLYLTAKAIYDWAVGLFVQTSRSLTVNGTTQDLSADRTFTVTDANLSTSDITTNDVSTTKHGFAPKAPNDTSKFLRGDGTWATPSAGGLTYFTEAQNTTAPNVTVPVDSLTAVSAATNADFVIIPKGNGAILADIPDNLVTGGNKRGTAAVDLQMGRLVNTEVASGVNSVISGGYRNTASNTESSVGGGNNNVASGAQSRVGGGQSNGATNSYSTIGGGSNNTASGGGSVVSGGQSCSATNANGSVLGGFGNSASNSYSTVGGGISNTASGDRSTVIGGTANTASGAYSIAGGGSCIANQIATVAFGTNVTVNGIVGRNSYGYGLSVNGDAQCSTFIMRMRTTDGTLTTFTSEGTSAASNNQIILQNNSAFRFKGTIIAKQTATTNVAAWDIDGLIVRGANAAATTLLISTVTVVQNTPGWGTPTLSADTTQGGLKIQIQGAGATNIQWVGDIKTTEVLY